MILKTNLIDYFQDKLERLNCQETTKAYIVSVFSKPTVNYSKDSITILYSEAKFSYKFDKFQNLADWILFVKAIYPEHLKDASEDYYNAVAQDSYYKCYMIMNRQLKIFEEIADNFPKITKTLNSELKHL
jgi:hypothetical protein